MELFVYCILVNLGGKVEHKVEHGPIVNVLCTYTNKRLTPSSLCIHLTKQDTIRNVVQNISAYIW